MDDELGFPFDIEYINNQHIFLDPSGDEPEEIVVWVESRSDIQLWSKVLRDSKSFTYDFRPASMFRGADGKLANGCNRLIKLWRSGELQGGRKSIFCLDGDYRFLAALSDEYSGDNYGFPHFYWTRIHSKEHVFIHEGVLDSLIAHIMCTSECRLTKRSGAVHRCISEAIYAPFLKILFVLSGSFESPSEAVQDFFKRLDSALKSLMAKPQGSFGSADCEIWGRFVSDLSDLAKDLDAYVVSEFSAGGVARFESKLKEVGVTASNLYLFYRGHDWYTLSFGIAKSYLEEFQRARLAEIRANSQDVRRDVGEFINQTPKFQDALLSIIPNVEDVPFFRDTVLLLRNEYPEVH